MAESKNCHKTDNKPNKIALKTIFTSTIDDSIFALLENFLATYKSSNKSSKSREHPSFIIDLAEKYSELQCTCPLKSKEELICAIEAFLCQKKIIHSESSSNSSEISAQPFQKFGLCDGSSESILTRIDKCEDNRRPKKLDPFKITEVIDQSLKLTKQGSEDKNSPLNTINKTVKKKKPYHPNKTNDGGRPLLPIKSMSSLLKVSPCSIYESTPVGLQIKKKSSWRNLIKKPKKLEKVRKSEEIDNVIEVHEVSDKPTIISTELTTCRINTYSDSSRVVEILRIKDENCSGDVVEKSDLVIIILPDGNTALFTSKCDI